MEDVGHLWQACQPWHHWMFLQSTIPAAIVAIKKKKKKKENWYKTETCPLVTKTIIVSHKHDLVFFGPKTNQTTSTLLVNFKSHPKKCEVGLEVELWSAESSTLNVIPRTVDLGSTGA